MPDLRTPADVADLFGQTERGLIRFARKHRVPIVEMKRGVYRFTEAAIQQLQEAACPSPSLDAKTLGRSGSRAPSGQRVRKSEDAYASARALIVENLQRKKPAPSKLKSSETSTSGNVHQLTALPKL
jgi:hypothetical protein